MKFLTTVRWHPRLRRAGGYAAWSAGLLLVLLAALYVAARLYWPTVASRKVDLEALLTQVAQHPVELGRIEPYWEGLSPGVRVSGATVYGEDGRTPRVQIAEVQGTLALLPLLWGRVELGQLVLHRPTLSLERRMDGRIGVVGLPAPAGAPAGGGGAWLLQQPRVLVHGGEIRWLDARDPDAALPLSHVELRLRNAGDRHRLTASATLPPSVCRECSVSADVTGNPMAGPWDGEVGLRAQGLNIAAVPLMLRERLPQELRGQFDGRLSSDWRDGRPQAVRGSVAVTGLRLPLGGDRRPFALRQMSADVAWRTADEGWRLDLSDLTLALTRRPWTAGRVRLVKTDAGASIELQRVDLDDVTASIAAHRAEHPMLQQWAQLRPSGALENLEMSVDGPLETPKAFRVGARLIDIGIAQHERIPGVRGLNGSIALDADGGALDFDGENVTLDLPMVFRAPLQARRAGGRVRWEKTETAWRITGRDLRVRSDDGNGTGSMTLQLPHDRAASPVLMLRIDFRDGNGAHAARYYPVRHLSPRTLEWMESAFVGGQIVSGHLIYEGPTRRFPFLAGEGRFELRGHVRDGVYRYLRGWTPLTQAEADVAIDGAAVRITGRGRIGGLQARDIRVEVGRADGAAERAVRVQGNVEGPVAESLRVLQAIERSRESVWQRYARYVGRAEGAGVLDLNVQVPLGRGEREPSFLAAYRFEDAALRLDSGAGLEAANGLVRFSEAGLGESSLRGNLFGGPFTAAVASDAGRLRVHAEGNLVLSQLLRAHRALAERVSGGVDWSLTWQQQPRGPQLRADANLSAVRSRLPAPFAQADLAGVSKLTVATELSRPDALVLTLSGGHALSAKAAFAREQDEWRLQKGRLEVGKATTRLPQRDGLEVGLSVDALDVDRWLPLWSGSSSGAGAQQPVFDRPLALTADIKRLHLANRHWGRVFAHVVSRGAEWRTVVDGDALAGEGTLAFAPKVPPRIRLDLAYLRLPERADADPSPSDKEPTDPRRLPQLDVHAISLEYKTRKYGELNLNATPYDQGWRIERFNLKRPEMQLAVDGLWRSVQGRQSTELNLAFDSGDMGATLDAFGATGQMADGKVKVRSKLVWPGSPLRPTLGGLDGNIEVSAEKGRFLKFDPGATRLFGLLDLRSIGRYLTLDFSPAFGKGFLFDAIHGNITMERGNASTNDFLVKGPSLSLRVDGRVGLAAEDYDLVLEASPKFGNTLTFTSWGLLGPQAAAAVLALQRLFRRQIEAGTRVTYTIKGPWDNPKITKVGKPAPVVDPPPSSP